MTSETGLGRINALQLIAKTPVGWRLDCRELALTGADRLPLDSVLLTDPESEIDTKVGDLVEVFLYRDSKDDVIATRANPHAQVGDCAYLKVVSTNQFGAFLDWGLPKDLLLPHSEQAFPVRVGGSYVVYVFLDQSSGRVACSTHLHHFLSEEANHWQKKGQAVDLLIAAKSELGYKAVINGTSLGLIFHKELSQPLHFGDRMKGWIKNIREDGRIDLSIHSLDAEAKDSLSREILEKLKQSGGRLDLSDKSSPEEIFRVFKVSKKNFKRAISTLYKQRIIDVQPTFITLV